VKVNANKRLKSIDGKEKKKKEKNTQEKKKESRGKT